MAKAAILSGQIDEEEYISTKFHKKLFQKRYRRCRHCGVPATLHPYGMPSDELNLKMYLSVEGVVAVQELMCRHCEKTEMITSSDVDEEPEKFLQLSNVEVEYYSKKVNHQDIIHDLLELLHLAAISDPIKRKARHSEVTLFVMQKARVICEEWCRSENSELRYRKFLMIFNETAQNAIQAPDASSDVSKEYKEMYQMLKTSFQSNKTDVELLLCLMKETLFDSPTIAAFMMWMKVAMLHTDQLSELQAMYGRCSYFNDKSYVDLMEKFLALDIPLGLKKIPVAFILFELPRFYHYIEFYNKKCGNNHRRRLITDADYKIIEDIETRMKFLKQQESKVHVHVEESLSLEDRLRKVIEDHQKRADEVHSQAPDGDHVLGPHGIHALGVGSTDESKSLVNAYDTSPIQIKKKTMTDTHAKIDDLEISIQSTTMTHFIKPVGEAAKRKQKEIDSGKPMDKCIDSTKVTDINPETGCMDVFERITFKFTDDTGRERQTVLVQTEPKRSRIVGYDRNTFKLADLGKYPLIPIPYVDDEEFPLLDPATRPAVATSIDQLPLDVQKILRPLTEEIKRQEELASGITVQELPSENSEQSFPNNTITGACTKTLPPEIDELKTDVISTSLPVMDKDESFEKPPTDLIITTTTPPTDASGTTTVEKSELSKSDEVVEDADTVAASKVIRKPRSKRPHYKYGIKWRKNKVTYDVDEVTDSDSDKEEEYTFYPCKLLSEYVESQNIVEKSPNGLSPDVISLTEFLEKRNIHRSLWTIKKKYIQNELFVILDISQDSEKGILPLVSASNNRGVSVPVLPILNPSSDSSVLDMTIGSLYCIQVANKLSNKQRNVFQRYVRIAVARARHSELFGSISLGAIKYVKTNDKRVEVKLSVKDMQYEARNEEESERRKIIRLLKRAGAEQDSKKKEEKSKVESVTEDSQKEELQKAKTQQNITKPLEEVKPTSTAISTGHPSATITQRSFGGKQMKHLRTLNTLSEKKKAPLVNFSPNEKNTLSSKTEKCDGEVLKKKIPNLAKKKLSAERRREVKLKVDEATSKSSAAEVPDTVSFCATDPKRGKVTFREKFSKCSYCNSKIDNHIRVCSGCRKVCYCNSKCQKSHWKIHKRHCVWALKKDQKETTG